jgi:hypothetical protein
LGLPQKGARALVRGDPDPAAAAVSCLGRRDSGLLVPSGAGLGGVQAGRGLFG